jgi:pimeloyl-ACP methyl ester carboxylesterase
VIVGHDWGAPVAWNSALLRPDVFRAVVGMSVPYAPPASIDLLTALERQGVTTFYMQYFEQEGVAEQELEADVAATLRRITYSMSGDGPGRTVAGILRPGTGILDATVDPDALPDWLSQADLEYVVAEFRRTGFRGGLNWYRAIRKSAELLCAWRGCPIRQPSLFIGGSRDDVLRFPGMQQLLAALPQALPGLRGTHLLEGAGHWVQRERAREVNELLLSFLRELDG